MTPKPTEKEIMNVLGKKYVLPMILLIDQREETIQTDLRAVSRSMNTIARLAEDLQRIGLVKIEMACQPRKTLIYSLTPKGKRFAKALQGLREIVPEEF